MATYIITDCINNMTYNVSGTSFSEGETIGFYIGEEPFCGIVGQETTDPITPLSIYDSTFSDCCECLSAITEFLNFKFTKCDTLEEINIEATNFCDQYGIPTTGLTYEIQFGTETSFCATFVGLSPTGETNYSYVSGPFSVCEYCGEEPEPPRSANTETFICIPDCEFTGSTAVSPPHPVWTDGYGTPVTQLNMVVLGGPNGLNA